MEFFGKSFTEAVELLTGEKGAAPPPDRPSPAPLSDFRLPPRSTDNRIARNYLTAARRIDEDVTGFFFSTGDIYEEAAHHNAVFVGRDESGIPRYAHQRGIAGSFRLDVKGSDKAFNFCYRGEGERLFVFEAPIDLLSSLCLFKKDWQKQSYLALGGVGEKALLRFLSDRPNIKTVFLCLDSDEAGNDACSRLAELVPEGLTVHRLIPLFKDWNEVLQHRAEITDGKYLREAVYGFCRNKEDALRTKEAVTAWITERLRLEVSPEKTRIVNVRKRYSEFLGFKIRVRPKSRKYIVQSHICDKKLELERQKLVEQAKRIARPSEGKRPLDEIRLYNSMVLGIQNYFQLATCISIDCRKIHRQVMTVLTNRLNTETGCRLVREGGTMTESEKERFGKSAMIRYVSGIDQPIYPIAYIKNKIPMAKKAAVCSYTVEGRALIHTNLSMNSSVLSGLRNQPSMGRSTELTDSRISLFSAQRGKCALSGELFENAADIVCWLKTPAELGGKERYRNMILFHNRFLPLLQECPKNELKEIADTLKATKELMLKVNSLRQQAGLSAIEN